jgi:hypothetical protein
VGDGSAVGSVVDVGGGGELEVTVGAESGWLQAVTNSANSSRTKRVCLSIVLG